MDLDLAAFSLGFSDRLSEKKAHSTNFLDNAINENILPSIQSQTNWKYVQTPEGLRLSDGNKVYGFGLRDFGGELSRVPKLDDTSILDFENGKLSGGTAQIHRSSPDSIYMTLANGRENPTFVLEHDEGKDWKYLPSKKMIKRLKSVAAPQGEVIPQVSPEALLSGAQAEFKAASVADNLKADSGLLGSPAQANEMLWNGIQGGKELLQRAHNNPGLVIGGTVLGGLLLNQLRKKVNPAHAQNMADNPRKDFNRSIGIPLLAGAGIVGLGGLV